MFENSVPGWKQISSEAFLRRVDEHADRKMGQGRILYSYRYQWRNCIELENASTKSYINEYKWNMIQNSMHGRTHQSIQCERLLSSYTSLRRFFFLWEKDDRITCSSISSDQASINENIFTKSNCEWLLYLMFFPLSTQLLPSANCEENFS